MVDVALDVFEGSLRHDVLYVSVQSNQPFNELLLGLLPGRQQPWRDMAMSPRQGTAFVTTRKGCCYLTVKVGRKNFPIMRIRNYKIDAQDKRDMRRLHPDIMFDRKKITDQLAEKREVCRQYRSRRQRTTHRPQEPFYGVVDPLTRTVYVSDPSDIAGVGALLQTASQHCLRLWGMKPTVLDPRNLSDLHSLVLLH
jgi:hypothetical protein